MKLALLCALFCLLVVPHALANSTAARIEDVAALCNALEANHADLYASISREAFAQKRASLEAALPELTDGEFAYALMGLAASVGDAHTTVAHTQSAYKTLTALPFAVMPMDGRWYLAMCEAEYASLLGYEVTAIEGVPMAQVFERAKAYISHDNEAWAHRQCSNTINFLEGLRMMGVAAQDAQAVTLALSGPNGEAAQLTAPGLLEAEIMRAQIVSLAPRAYADTWAAGYYRALLLDEETLFIQYNTCQDAPQMSVAEFAQQLQPYVQSEQVARVIIDLRYNTGGNSMLFEPILALLEEECTKRAVQVYTLIGMDTFSSAVMNAVDTVRRLDAVLAGSPTGGSVNSFGEVQHFTLPHAPLVAYYSTKAFELMPGYEGTSLMPEIVCGQTFADYMSGVDTAVRAIMESTK